MTAPFHDSTAFGPLVTADWLRRNLGDVVVADVRWYLSLDPADLPPETVAAKQTTYRSVTIGGDELEFSTGFTDLHTMAYEEILAGNGYGIDAARPSIEVVHHMRTAPIEVPTDGQAHPLLRRG